MTSLSVRAAGKGWTLTPILYNENFYMKVITEFWGK